MDAQATWDAWGDVLGTGVGVAVAAVLYVAEVATTAPWLDALTEVVVPVVLLAGVALVTVRSDLERTRPFVAVLFFLVAAVGWVYVAFSASPVVLETPFLVLATVGWLVLALDRGA